jgi:hypothetical protein
VGHKAVDEIYHVFEGIAQNSAVKNLENILRIEKILKS